MQAGWPIQASRWLEWDRALESAYFFLPAFACSAILASRFWIMPNRFFISAELFTTFSTPLQKVGISIFCRISFRKGLYLAYTNTISPFHGRNSAGWITSFKTSEAAFSQ